MIASPSDVNEARDAAERAIHDWNLEHSEARQVVFVPWRWEESAIPSLEAPAQSIINAQGVDRSDLIVALFGSRLGSPTAAGVSGTVEEIERARAQGKPVHLYFSNQSRPSNLDPDQLKRLLEFKQQVSDLGLHGSFDSTDDLRRKVESALSFYQSDVSAQKRSDYFDRGVSDRVYEEVAISWAYRIGALDADTWDATTEQVRKLTVRDHRGLSNFTISLNKDGDLSAPSFGDDRLPTYELDPVSSRTSQGSITLRSARRKSGTSYAQEIQFSPQLTEGDSAHLIYRGVLPSYKFAHKEQIVAGSPNSKLGLRDWDFNAFEINHPVALFSYSVFLPDSLGATPLGPRVDHNGSVDTDLTAGVLKSGYSQERTEIDGEVGTLMKIVVREPAFKCVYRLRWSPPSKS